MDNQSTDFDTNAEALCLSFANAFDIHENGKHEEMFKEYSDLVEWAQILKVIDRPLAQLLLHGANQNPEDAFAVLQSAWVLRKAIYNIFTSIAHHKSPEPGDLNILNVALSDTLVHYRIELNKEGFIWGWNNTPALDQMIWYVIRDTADLLTGDSLNRIGQCTNVTGCGWLFLDTSRNRSRRWCSMETCGNRAKAMRHYQRMKY